MMRAVLPDKLLELGLDFRQKKNDIIADERDREGVLPVFRKESYDYEEADAGVGVRHFCRGCVR